MTQIVGRAKFGLHARWWGAYGLLIVAFGAYAENPSAQFLERVSGNVAEQQHVVPDFVANEDVTVRAMESGRLVHQKHIVSQFQAVYNSAKQKHDEQRKIVSASEDGKPLSRTTYVLPLAVRGGFADDAAAYLSEFHKFSSTLRIVDNGN